MVVRGCTLERLHVMCVMVMNRVVVMFVVYGVGCIELGLLVLASDDAW